MRIVLLEDEIKREFSMEVRGLSGGQLEVNIMLACLPKSVYGVLHIASLYRVNRHERGLHAKVNFL